MKKLIKKESNVFKEVFPLCMILKFSGMFPLSFNKDGELRTNFFDKFLPIIAMILMAFASTLVYAHVLNVMQEMDFMMRAWYLW